VEAVHLKEFLTDPEDPPDTRPAIFTQFEVVNGRRMNVGKLVPGMVIRMNPVDSVLYVVRTVSDSRAYCVKVRPSDRARVSDASFIYLDREGDDGSGGTSIASRSLVEVLDPDALGDAFARKAAQDRLLKGKPVPVYEEATTKEVNMAVVVGLPVAGGAAKANKVRLARKAAGKVALPGNKANAARKAAAAVNGNGRAPKETRSCACGCGAQTTGHFAPGHDARYHGWVKKLARGETPDNLPAKVKNAMKLKAKGEGWVPTASYKD